MIALYSERMTAMGRGTEAMMIRRFHPFGRKVLYASVFAMYIFKNAHIIAARNPINGTICHLTFNSTPHYLVSSN